MNNQNEKYGACFGYLYDPYVDPCRNVCDGRFLCKEQVSKRMSEDREGLKQQQRRIIAMTDELNQEEFKEQEATKKLASMNTSDLVSKIWEKGTQVGYRVEQLGCGYIAFKHPKKNRNIFATTRLKADNLENLVKLVYYQNKEEVPESVRHLVSNNEERCGGFLIFKGTTVEEFEQFIQTCLDSICPKG